MKTVAAVLIEGMAPLDLFGPIQAFNAAYAPSAGEPDKPDRSEHLYRVITISREKGPVSTGDNGAGPIVVADYGFGDDAGYDILLVPGGVRLRTMCGKSVPITLRRPHHDATILLRFAKTAQEVACQE